MAIACKLDIGNARFFLNLEHSFTIAFASSVIACTFGTWSILVRLTLGQWSVHVDVQLRLFVQLVQVELIDVRTDLQLGYHLMCGVQSLEVQLNHPLGRRQRVVCLLGCNSGEPQLMWHIAIGGSECGSGGLPCDSGFLGSKHP